MLTYFYMQQKGPQGFYSHDLERRSCLVWDMIPYTLQPELASKVRHAKDEFEGQ